MPPTHSPAIRSSSGFTYIGLLIVVAIMGITLATIGTFWHTTQQRLREQQLISIGLQFSRAITAYYQNSPGGTHQYPKRLEDMLQDQRYPDTVRYLRKIFTDPITGKTEWGLVKGADGGIVGVYSLSGMAPFKTGNFAKGLESLQNKKHYSEWKFFYDGNLSNSAASGATSQNGGGSAGVPWTYGSPGNTSVVADGTSTPNGNAANSTVPSAYQVPPPEPLPDDPTADDQKMHLCQIMRVNDASTCAKLAADFGDEAGAICMASAGERYAICISQDVVALPPLVVQYK